MSRRATSRRLVSLTVLLACAATPLLADSFYTVTPCRVFDTRGTSSPLSTNIASTFAIGGSCGVPVEATAVACNSTLLPQGGISVDLGEYPGDLSFPTSTNVVSANPSSSAIAGFSVMTLSNDGQGSVAFLPNSGSSGFTDVLFDVTGYFLADSPMVGWPGPSFDDDPGPTDNPAVAYTDTLGQGSAASGSSPVGPLVAGQGGAGAHYFVSNGQPVPLIGVSADNGCHLAKTGAGQCNLSNYQQVISDAANYGLNVIRLWVSVGGLPASGCAYDSMNADPNDQPFNYDSSNRGNDGLGRWQLDVQNSTYFQHLQQVIQYASSLNPPMHVEVTLFAPQQGQLYLSPWSPAHASLKNPPPPGNSAPAGFTDTSQFVNSSDPHYANMSPYVKNVVTWTVDALSSFPNVYYEVANEPEWIRKSTTPSCPGWTTQSTTHGATVAAWQDAIAQELKAEMAAKGVTQLIAVEASTFCDADQFRSTSRPGVSCPPGASGAGPYTSDASIINSHYTRLSPHSNAIDPVTGKSIPDGLGAIRLSRAYYSQPKILGFNETKIVAGGCPISKGATSFFEGVPEGRAEAWEFMINQGGVYNQFGYGCAPPPCPPATTVPAGSDYCETRRQMGALRKFLSGPLNIGRNMVTSTSGVQPNGSPDWVSIAAYPTEPLPTNTAAKFWAAVEPIASAATKRWLLYIHQSQDRGLVQDGYRMPVSTPGAPPLPPHPGETLSVCLGSVSGTYTAYWINPADPITTAGLPKPIMVNNQPVQQTINWTGTTSCKPGGSGSKALNPSPPYPYDIALFISP